MAARNLSMTVSVFSLILSHNFSNVIAAEAQMPTNALHTDADKDECNGMGSAQASCHDTSMIQAASPTVVRTVPTRSPHDPRRGTSIITSAFAKDSRISGTTGSCEDHTADVIDILKVYLNQDVIGCQDIPWMCPDWRTSLCCATCKVPTPAPTPSWTGPGSKPKILVLHGVNSNAADFQMDPPMASLRNAVSSSFELVFVDAPCPYGTPNGTYHNWWPDNNDVPDPTAESRNFLRGVVQDQGPFYGILGYSAGASLIPVYLSHFPGEFEVALLFSGDLPVWDNVSMQAIDAASPIGGIHTLVFTGSRDPVTLPEWTLQQSKKFSSPVVLRSDTAAHHMPWPTDPTFNQVVSFLHNPSTSPVVSAAGDPHVVNALGQRFDLFEPGTYTLIQIPKNVKSPRMLRVQAEATRIGVGCGELYFTRVNVTGIWTKSHGRDGLSFTVSTRNETTSTWEPFGKVSIKVVHGRTRDGISYLNIFVRGLSKVGANVGGLMGDGDHTYALTRRANCGKKLILTTMVNEASQAVVADQRASEILKRTLDIVSLVK